MLFMELLNQLKMRRKDLKMYGQGNYNFQLRFLLDKGKRDKRPDEQHEEEKQGEKDRDG
jgi:hypothetical protein